ncbi:Bor family protein [Rheinheimera sp. EpRS3]|uniref:Bor family protein n=1 Tax=Rheinheimera sp. EpRS3 TaxID=1712383 RepID=UPI00074916D9|nr:Bor family protein [Rheinheimera sp. EpRS3]KUM54761.1 Bor family protein [Rheinheimera sp. EpRS3]
MLRVIAACMLITMLSACSTVTVHPQNTAKLSSEPTYKDSKPFYLWGLIGEHHVDVSTICKGEEPAQMQTQQTFTDGLLGVVTLGIYLPHTAKVWC